VEKSSGLIKVPQLTAVYDVSGVAAFNSLSSNPIWLATCQLHGQRKGEGGFTAPSPAVDHHDEVIEKKSDILYNCVRKVENMVLFFLS
jgi:hypothetical protein